MHSPFRQHASFGAAFVAVVLGVSATPGAQQEQPAAKPPQKGDRVIVRGCLSGPVLEATDLAAVDATPTLTSAVTFRLTGEKNLLKQMRKDEDGKVVQITGVLKSELPQADTRRGKQIGKTRIVVGVGSPQTMQPQAMPSLPVLEVKSYEPLAASCGG